MLTAIRQWVIKTMMKGNTGVVQTMPKQQIIEMNVQITAERMLRNGINPNDMKTVGQVENVVKQIEQPKVISADSAEGKGITEQLFGKKKADVMDMEGNKIPEGSKIMGGKEVPTSIESDAAIKARLDGDNKKGIAGIQISLVDDSIAKIKSMEPMDAMKEANLVAGKKGRYANLDDNQVNKIIDDTNDHIFERDIPDEDFATGGRVGLKTGMGKAFLEFLKKFKVKQSGDGVSEFLDKRKFLKSMVGETEKNKKARELKMLKDAMEDARENPGFEFKDVDIEKDIRPILDQSKDRTLNADGGRIGFKSGLGKAFLEFLKNTGKTINDKNPIDLGKDYFKYIKDESIKGNSKKIAPGVIAIGSGGALANRYVGRRLEEMNKEQKMEMYEDTKKEFIEEYKNDPQLLEIMLKNLDDRTFGKVEEKADGGRIGLKAGMTKRAFLKLMGAGVAGVGAVKSGLFSIGKGATKQAAKEVAQQTTSGTPPAYFFKLAEKIKKLGDDVTAKAATQDRQIVKQYKDFEMTEDVATGEIQIMKSGQSDEAIDRFAGENATEEVFMRYKPSEKILLDEANPGGGVRKTLPEFEANTSYISNNRGDTGGVLEELDGVPNDILEEVGEAKSIKYASGGLAYMLGE